MEPRVNEVDEMLFDYQREHVRTILAAIREHGSAIDASDTGTGKTYTAAAVCRSLGVRPIVICPKAVVTTWYAVLADFVIEPLAVINYETAKNGKYYPNLDAFLIEHREDCPYIERRGEGGASFVWLQPRGSIIIFDEAHKGKNSITANSRLMLDARANNTLPAEDRLLLILSATITDRVANFRTSAYLLGLSQQAPHAYRAWLGMLRDGDPGRNISQSLNRVLFGGAHPRRGTEATVGQHTPRGSRMSITAIRAVADLFRANDVRAEVYDMSPEVEAEIEEQYAIIAEALEALRNKENDGDMALVKLIRARQRIELLKVPTFVELIIAAVTAEQSVVAFVNFTETADRIASSLEELELASPIVFIRGGQTVAERSAAVDDFQRNRAHVMLANMAAGGVGISLHDLHGRQRLALHSPSWSSIDFKQALGRIYRAGAMSNAIQRIVYCRGRTRAHRGNDAQFRDPGEAGGRIGVEELMAQNVNEKLLTIEWINSGDTDNVVLIEPQPQPRNDRAGPGDIHW